MDDAAEHKPDFTTLGTRTTSAANAGLIVGTTPIAILVLAALAGHGRLTAGEPPGSLLYE